MKEFTDNKLEGITSALLDEEISQLRKRVAELREMWSKVRIAPEFKLQFPSVSEEWKRFRDFKLNAFPEIPEQVEIVSFDVFDTLLRRVTGTPDQVFRLLSDQYAFDKQCSHELFFNARCLAEAELRKEVLALNSREDVSLETIYRKMGEQFNWTVDEVEWWKNREIDLECTLIKLIPEAVDYMQDLMKRGKRIMLISEMYLSGETVRKFFECNGVNLDGIPIFTSGDSGKSKGTGNLYRACYEQMGVPFEKAFHIGDNANTDIRVPQELGVQTHRVEKFDYTCGDALADILMRTSCHHNPYDKKTEYWQWLGFSTAGPLQLSFVLWILNMTKENPNRPIWFLSRDGYFLHKIAHLVCDKLKLSRKLEYVYASRKFLNLAAMSDITAEDWDFLLKASPLMRVRDFFERVGLNESDYSDVCLRHGFEDLDLRITHHWGFKNPPDRDRLYRVFCDVITLFHESKDREAERAKEYFQYLGLDHCSPYLIDLGWSGSAFFSVRKFIGKQGWTSHPTGLYFHLWETAEKHRDLFSFSFYSSHSKRVNATVKPSVSILEFLFSAPHGTVESVVKEENKFLPIMRCEPSMDHSEKVNMLGEGIEKFTASVLPIFDYLPETRHLDCLLESLIAVVMEPDGNDLKNLGSVQHGEGWGVCHSLRMLPRINLLTSIEQRLGAMAYCPWKAGLKRC